jgi:hypothetical protein
LDFGVLRVLVSWFLADSSEESEIASTSNEMLGMNLGPLSDVSAGIFSSVSASFLGLQFVIGLTFLLVSRTDSSHWEEKARSPPAADQPAEMEVQQPPAPPPSPTDQSVPAAEVADHPMGEAAPAPEMVVPTAASVSCLGCGREPALVRLVPVKHDCLGLTCRSNPSGSPRCVFCDGTRR